MHACHCSDHFRQSCIHTKLQFLHWYCKLFGMLSQLYTKSDIATYTQHICIIDNKIKSAPLNFLQVDVAQHVNSETSASMIKAIASLCLTTRPIACSLLPFTYNTERFCVLAKFKKLRNALLMSRVMNLFISEVLLFQSQACHSILSPTIPARHCNYPSCFEKFHCAQSIGLGKGHGIQRSQGKSLS